jgi:hypothetical protein
VTSHVVAAEQAEQWLRGERERRRRGSHAMNAVVRNAASAKRRLKRVGLEMWRKRFATMASNGFASRPSHSKTSAASTDAFSPAR